MIATVRVGASPRVVAVTPDGVKVYVANRLSNDVSVIRVEASQTAAASPTPVATQPSLTAGDTEPATPAPSQATAAAVATTARSTSGTSNTPSGGPSTGVGSGLLADGAGIPLWSWLAVGAGVIGMMAASHLLRRSFRSRGRR